MINIFKDALGYLNSSYNSLIKKQLKFIAEVSSLNKKSIANLVKKIDEVFLLKINNKSLDQKKTQQRLAWYQQEFDLTVMDYIKSSPEFIKAKKHYQNLLIKKDHNCFDHSNLQPCPHPALSAWEAAKIYTHQLNNNDYLNNDIFK